MDERKKITAFDWTEGFNIQENPTEPMMIDDA